MSSERFNVLMDGMALLQYNCEQRVSDDFSETDRRNGLPDRRSGNGNGNGNANGNGA